MAGYREFQTGEVLTAANVNDFLMDQSVMKFADAAARDTALGTAVGGANALREGMVAYLDSTDEVLAYNGTAWSALGNAGIGSNVVQTVKTDTFSTSSTTFVTATGLTATITPTSTSSKVLLIAQLAVGNDSQVAYNSMMFKFGGGNSDTYKGDAASTRERAVAMFGGGDRYDSRAATVSATMVYLDSPNTTSATTYSVEVRSGSGTVYLNRAGADTDVSTQGRYACSITAIEVAA